MPVFDCFCAGSYSAHYYLLEAQFSYPLLSFPLRCPFPVPIVQHVAQLHMDGPQGPVLFGVFDGHGGKIARDARC